MANELQYYGNPDTESGIDVTLNILDSTGNLVASGSTVTEVNNTAVYITSMPTLQKDTYVVRFYGDSVYLATGTIYWDGVKEIDPINDMIREVWELNGLDSSKPLNVSQTTRTFGEVTQSISTTGESSSQETVIVRA